MYECTSADEVVDLLQGGQGVFGIAVSGAMRELTGVIADFPGERADGGESIAAPEDELAVASQASRPQDRLAESSHRELGAPPTASRTQNRARQLPRVRLCISSAVDWTTHRTRAGEFCGRQLRTPKEQHLSVNLSGTRTARDNDASGKWWQTLEALEASSGPHPPMGKGAEKVARRISQAPGEWAKTEGEGPVF